MRFIYYLILIILLFKTGACKKYLDEKPDKSLIVPTTIEDLQRILNDNFTLNVSTCAYGEVSTDDYFLLDESYNALEDFDRKSYTWKKFDYNYPNQWSHNYNKVYYANFCLEQVNKFYATAHDTKTNNVKGSALFFRAFSFLNLAIDYCKAYDQSTSNTDLGMVLRLGTDFNEKSVRSSVEETYSQIISDLKLATNLLPNQASNVMKPSKAASLGLLARTYLLVRNYDSALKYSNLSLQIKNDLLDYNSIPAPDASIPFPQYNLEIVFYSDMSTEFLSKSPSRALIDTLLFNSYDNDDLRKYIFFMPNGLFHSYKGSYAADAEIFFSGIAVDEIILTRAESYARKNMLIEASTDMNYLLSKRWITGEYNEMQFSSQEQAVDFILLERRKELLMRGLRWPDIKRLNKEGRNIILNRKVGSQAFLLPPNDSFYALPLPTDILRITGIQQN